MKLGAGTEVPRPYEGQETESKKGAACCAATRQGCGLRPGRAEATRLLGRSEPQA